MLVRSRTAFFVVAMLAVVGVAPGCSKSDEATKSEPALESPSAPAVARPGVEASGGPAKAQPEPVVEVSEPEAVAELETALGGVLTKAELFELIERLAVGDDDRRMRLLERAVTLYESGDASVERDPSRAADVYERILELRPGDLDVLDRLIECHRVGTQDLAALAKAAERKAALVDDPEDRAALRAYVADVRAVLAEEAEEAEATDAGGADPRFVPGDLPGRASTSVGFEGDGIYLSPSSPNTIVLLRSDGDYAPLSLLEPEANEKNQWRFGMPGTRISTSDPRLALMIKLPHEGFYKLAQEFRFGDDGLWVAGAIVQLGYTRKAEPIVFIAQRPSGEENTLFFSDKGVRIRRDQLKWLEPLSWYEDSESDD